MGRAGHHIGRPAGEHQRAFFPGADWFEAPTAASSPPAPADRYLRVFIEVHLRATSGGR
ncbi:hypothetical protein [Amycolatopsis sp. cmx-8-4]|uniref:hypothetical protein n=1 Tax=Amycolatopsis sp. cmx-8-4 TaxID=2790947 RepID=UPI00397D4136